MTFQLSNSFILSMVPGAKPEYVDQIVRHRKILTDGGIVSAKHVVWFLAQIATETQSLTRLEENLFYTSTKRLLAVFPTRISAVEAPNLVRNPQALANKVYGGRYGNVRPNDGWAYRGSGGMHTTFHDNYMQVQTLTGVKCVDRPDLLRHFPEALISAVIYWQARKLGRFVDADDLPGLTKAIQGGSSALAMRRTFTERGMAAIKLGGIDAGAPVTTGWLRNGSVGPEVTALQKKLQRVGYYDDGKLDGQFGDGTEKAVEELQRDNHLIIDGVVGPKTIKALDDMIAGNAPIPAPAQPLPTSPAPVEPVPGASAPTGLVGLLLALLSALAKLFSRGGKNG